jgi:Mce-associated membrane protein
MSKGTSVAEITKADDSEEGVTSTDEVTSADPGRDRSGKAKFTDRPIRLKTIISILVVAGLVGVSAFLAWQLQSTSSDLDSIEQSQANDARAEKISLDYATGAAEMDFQNPDEWRDRLTANTSPELANRLGQAATSMEQLIQPLQWTSTATPIAAKVESVTDGVYQVVTFVDVLTKNTQTPDGTSSTATYKMSIDSKNGWVITEISGMDPAIDPAAAPK